MNWVRLYITVEGETELRFVKETLAPHLVNFLVEVRPRMAPTNRKLGARGGSLGFERLRNDTQRLMKDDAHKAARFTTMIDLYTLPNNFPGWETAEKSQQPINRVEALEKSLHDAIPSERFIPYLQLHEFEALLYCDLEQLKLRIPGHDKEFQLLSEEVANIAPEDINEGSETAPSKRLINHIPRYERLKVRVGALTAGAIGLAALRQKCPHFDGWVGKLEKLPELVASA